MTDLPRLRSRNEIHQILQRIFPAGTPHRTYCTREIAASTVFTMLYIGAVEGRECYLAPKHVYRMSDEQAEKTDDVWRLDYAESTIKPGALPLGTPWYADNTREPIRDETLRQGLMPVGAAFQRNLPTTSLKGRYRLRQDFVLLFDPSLDDEQLEEAMEAWRQEHLSISELARIALIRSGASPDPDDYLLTFPNGETQRLSPGKSSAITKGVVERFATRFLEKPYVLWISESGNKVVARNDIQARKLGLDLDAGKVLPDVILVDMVKPITFVFVEVVATDGPITAERRNELEKITLDAGYPKESCAFVTAFMARAGPFKKVLADLAWNSFVWLASEPEGLISFEESNVTKKVWLHRRLKNHDD